MPEPLTILLSAEELRFALNLLQTETIPGLDAADWADLSPAQRDLALRVAGRALRAREWVDQDDSGAWLIQPDLLALVGTCAYAPKAILVYHWPVNQANPRRYFGHIRGTEMVAHTCPDEGLHRFSRLSSREEMLSQILAMCHASGSTAEPSLEVILTAADLAQVRELAEIGESGQAIDLLVSHDAAPQAAKGLVETLAGWPRLSLLRLFRQPETGAAQQRDLTLLQNSHQTWLIAAAPEEINTVPLRVKTTTRNELQVLLAEWL